MTGADIDGFSILALGFGPFLSGGVPSCATSRAFILLSSFSESFKPSFVHSPCTETSNHGGPPAFTLSGFEAYFFIDMCLEMCGISHVIMGHVCFFSFRFLLII